MVVVLSCLRADRECVAETSFIAASAVMDHIRRASRLSALRLDQI